MRTADGCGGLASLSFLFLAVFSFTDAAYENHKSRHDRIHRQQLHRAQLDDRAGSGSRFLHSDLHSNARVPRNQPRLVSRRMFSNTRSAHFHRRLQETALDAVAAEQFGQAEESEDTLADNYEDDFEDDLQQEFINGPTSPRVKGRVPILDFMLEHADHGVHSSFDQGRRSKFDDIPEFSSISMEARILPPLSPNRWEYQQLSARAVLRAKTPVFTEGAKNSADLVSRSPAVMVDREVVNPDAAFDSHCPSRNGRTFVSASGAEYQIICDLDFLGRDISYHLVDNYDDCVAQCDAYNAANEKQGCLAAIFVPTRLHGADDCYLKYATDNPASTSKFVEGALLKVDTRATPTGSNLLTPLAVEIPTSSTSGVAIKYASGNVVIRPHNEYAQLHGATKNKPAAQYIDHKSPPNLVLMKSLLGVGVELDLTDDYPISQGTGCLDLDATTGLLTDMKDTPQFSRDGGKGGVLNGNHIFVFCDTGSYTTTTDDSNGNFLGFVSSSVATDTGMRATFGEKIHLEDGIGQYSDNVGRLRGFAPLTQGEQSYNLIMQGGGQRYAVWPESSIVPLTSSSAILVAPIVYDNVNRATGATVFTYTGATLLTITAHGRGGPVASRTVARLFKEEEVEWGCVGGIRSWGPSGVGGSDGRVYLFGNVRGGLLLARTTPNKIADRQSYEYWNGNTWTHGMQTPSSTAYFITGSFMDVDVFYSPRHLTFVIVYLTIYADSTFYYRYLLAPDAIRPPYAPGGDGSSDYVEHLTRHSWSQEKVLYKAPPGLSGAYIYAGGVHQGYFGIDDVSNGGSKMLLSWSAPTGQDPASQNSEYQIMTGEVNWA